MSGNLFLEGGYDLIAAKACSMGVISALLKQDWSDPLGPSPKSEIDSFREMLDQAKEIWGL